MKKLIVITLIFSMILSFSACTITDNRKDPDKIDLGEIPATQESFDVTAKEKVNVEICVLGYGTMKFELYPDIAPITVQNFVDLATSGFYDGLTFHRIISNFMIQGGDPAGDGTGGSGKTIKGEFSKNGVKNDLLHTKGVISMARRGDNMDSATSQFFIVSADSYPSLDGSYAAFGKMTSGYKILSALEGVATDENDKPIETITIKYIRVIED